MNAIARSGQVMSDWSDRNMPDPYLFAVILTLIAFVFGWALTDNGPLAMIEHWYAGFWQYLTFGMQMVLILVTGHALAIAPGIHPLLQRLARLPANGGQAVVITTVVATSVAYLHWGLGLIVAAIFAREVAKEGYRKNLSLHYPLLIAAAYTGQMVWHVGPSSSAALLSASEGHVFEDTFGIIPVTDSVFSVYAVLIAVMLCLFVVPVTMWLMTPGRPEDCRGIDQYMDGEKLAQELRGEAGAHEQQETGGEQRHGFADRIENSSIISYLIGAGGVTYIIYYFATEGLVLNLNIFNFMFLIAGLILHGTPIRYVRAVRAATPGTSGIILQFPFYAGIMGMISFSGLAQVITAWIVSFASAASFPIIVWLTGAILNIFVPSGGGEWGVIGGIVGQVSVDLGVPVGKTIVAFGCGDMWTNMFQPFWAIALLGIAGLRARDIMGYCMILLLVSAPFFAAALYFFPYQL